MKLLYISVEWQS